ncbi:hypothetical protein [Paenibacillus planticolens]|uniref:Uncharacterized protein n=1 Tax=Paenibacillus planticolens TaxID=2654976 RepID=A0ABX1ZML2_9BACL|nr:hypothetical protein [Paenibacillus planticolens]NOV00183.1 hypothetical protein [Paenibacillus planticolens]
MAMLTVFYDYHEEGIVPVLLSLRFSLGELDFSQDSLYVPLEAPFQQLAMEDICDLDAGITVLMEDLIVHPERPHAVGISLSRLRQRHAAYLEQLTDIQQLWLRMHDIEEVLQMDMRSLYRWS